MKMRILTLLPQTVRRVGLTLSVLALAATSALSFPVITNVVETGGDAPDIQGNGYADTYYAQWTGLTHTNHQANEPIPGLTLGQPYTITNFGNWAPTFVDRNNRYTNTSFAPPVNLPGYLVGGEYILCGNDNRDNASYKLDVSVSVPVLVFMLVDNRLSDGNNADPANYGEGIDPAGWTTMTWLGTDGFKPVLSGLNRAADLTWPDEVGLDEGSDGTINNWFCVYWRQVPAGTFSLYQANNSGRSMYGAVVTDITPPAPADVQAASLQARVILNWSVSAGATNYIVRRSQSSGGPYADIATTPTTSFTDTTVVNDQTYYYVVAAVGLLNTSANSAQVIGAPKQAKPEGLVAAGGNSQISLSWNALPGAASYTVKRADASGGPFANIASGIAAASYVDSGLPGGRRYYYMVSAALTAGGESANSDEVSALTTPGLPTGFVAEQFATTVIRLKWNSADVVPPTTLVEKSPDGTAFAQVGAVTNGGKHYFDVALGANVTNYYRVRATNSTGLSAYTAVSSASTPSGGLNVNFANFDFTNTTGLYPVPGYLDDFGLVYGDQGNGYSYGWEADNTSSARWSGSVFSPDERYDTMTHLQKPDPSGHTWEIGVPNGLYLVHIVSGQATAFDSVFQWDLEGWVSAPKTPSDANRWQDFLLTTKVEDGRMTFNNGPSASNNKIAFVDIYPTTPQPNAIATQPISQTVTQNQPVSFSVVVGGGPEPYRFQWYGPAGLISGAEGASYTIPLSQPADNGSYYVVVTNAGASVQSSSATLTVIADVIAPVVLQTARGPACADTLVTVSFSEVMDPTTATDIATYEIVNLTYGFSLGTPAATPSLAADGKTVELTAASSLTNGALYKVIVKNAKDLALNSSGIVNKLITLNGALVPSGPQNLVVAEAENYDVVTRRVYNGTEYNWAFETSRLGFSGAGVMHNLPDIGNRCPDNEGASIDFCVNFPAAATYYVWVRGGADNSAASIHIGIDGAVSATAFNLQAGFASPPGNYAWCGWYNGGMDLPATVDVPSAGVHTISIFMREDGLFADKLLLTTDSGYAPSGLGPAETPREQANVPMIEIISGSLHVTGGKVSMTVQTVQGLNNIVEYKDALTDPTWTTLTSFTGTGAIVPITDSGPLPVTRFYRARAVIP